MNTHWEGSLEVARRKKKILGTKWEKNSGCRKVGKKESGLSSNGWFSAGNCVCLDNSNQGRSTSKTKENLG